MKSSPLRRALFGLLFASFLLGIVEIVARAALGPPPSTGLIRQMWKEDQPIFVEADGMASPEYQGRTHGFFRVTPDRPRVFLLGESSVHDGAVRLNEEIAPSIARSLQHQRVPAEVICLGRPGNDSHDNRIVLDQALRYEPQVVVIYAGHNDIGNAFMLQRFGDVTSSVAARVQVALERFWLYAGMRRLLVPITYDPNQFAQLGPPYDEPTLDEARRTRAEGAFKQNLSAMVAEAQDHGATVVLATVVSNLMQWRFQIPVCPEALPEGTWQMTGSGPELTGHPTREQIDAALALSPECPEALHLRGLDKLTSGDPKAGLVDLKAAQALERIQLRATPGINVAIREVADERGAILADVEAALQAEGPADTNLFADNLHPSAMGAATIAEAIAPAVVQALGAQSQTWGPVSPPNPNMPPNQPRPNGPPGPQGPPPQR